MSPKSTAAIVVLVAVCGITSLILRSVVDGSKPHQDGASVLAIAAPRATEAGDRYVAYAGVQLEVGESHLMRMCAETGPCPVRRTLTAATTEESWGWLATYAPTIPRGSYAAEFFVRRPGLFGVDRTVERFLWDHHVD